MEKILLSWVTVMFLFVLCIPQSGQTEESSATFPAELTGDQLYEQGLNLYGQEKYQEAIPYFKEAAKRKPNFCDAYYQLSLCYLETKWPGMAWEGATFVKIISQDKNLREKAAEIPKEIERREKEIEDEEFSKEYKKWSEEFDKKVNEKAELARQEREKIRLAQVEAERARREEISNYLATLSENRRFLVTEIAKYYQGEQLKNTYEIAKLSEGRSDEEVQIILNNVRALRVTQRTE